MTFEYSDICNRCYGFFRLSTHDLKECDAMRQELMDDHTIALEEFFTREHPTWHQA